MDEDKKLIIERFDQEEIDALRKIAKERIAYDTITSKLKNNWIWVVATGVLTIWAVSDHIINFFKAS